MSAPEVRQVEFNRRVQGTTETCTHKHRHTYRHMESPHGERWNMRKSRPHHIVPLTELEICSNTFMGCWSRGFTRWCWTFHTFPAPPITSGKAGHNADVSSCTIEAIQRYQLISLSFYWFTTFLVFTWYIRSALCKTCCLHQLWKNLSCTLFRFVFVSSN